MPMDSIADALQVSCGAVLGVLTRVGLGRAFGPYGGRLVSSSSPIFRDLPANLAGSLLAGVFSPFKASSARFHASMPHFVATGYLGSLTTFASWNLQVTQMLVDGTWLGAIAAVILGTLLPLASFAVGMDIGQGLSFMGLRRKRKRRNLDEHNDLPPASAAFAPNTESASQPSPAWGAASCICVSGAFLACLLAAMLTCYFVDTSSPVRRRLWLSALLAPTGALGRWQLSRLNARHSHLPVGTLLANFLACALDAVLAALLTRVALSADAGDVLRALITGAGGTLSTVSTWVGEVTKLRSAGGHSTAWAYLYIFASLGLAQAIGIAIYGTAVWTN